MNTRDWKRLLNGLEVATENGDVAPVGVRTLNTFEDEYEIKLPSSYRSYCRVFGAGQIANEFNIAVPGFTGTIETYSVEYLSQSQIGLADEYAELGVDPIQLKRGIFFGLDIAGSNHFLDPNDVTDSRRPEYAVYTLFRNYELQRTADSFGQFVTEYCLGERHSDLVESGTPPAQAFRPIGS